ncbi:uncharacterized protein [Amphiura filiformis]|uniref:uncharacterized protein n=1 Tax=Amphiura filiformis TaxID=82378 RepID=UPI003B218F75
MNSPEDLSLPPIISHDNPESKSLQGDHSEPPELDPEPMDFNLSPDTSAVEQNPDTSPEEQIPDTLSQEPSSEAAVAEDLNSNPPDLTSEILPEDLTTNAPSEDLIKQKTSDENANTEVKIKQEVIEVNNNDDSNTSPVIKNNESNTINATSNTESTTTNNINSSENQKATNLNNTTDSNEVIKPKRKRYGYKIRANRGRRRSSSGSPARPMPAELTKYLNLAPISGVNKDLAPRPVPIHVGSGQKAPIDYSKMMEDAKRSFPVAPLTQKPRLPTPHISPVQKLFQLPSPRLLAPAQTRIQAHFPPVPIRVPQPQQEPLCLTVKPQNQQQQPVITVPISSDLQISIPITPELLQKLALPAFANLPITPETLQQVAALAALSKPSATPQIPLQQLPPQARPPQARPIFVPTPTPVTRESIRQQLARPAAVPNVLGNSPIGFTVPQINKPSPAPTAAPTPPPKLVRRRFTFPNSPPILNPVALSMSAINHRYSDDPPTPSPTDRKPPLLIPASPCPSSEDSLPPTPSPSSVTSPIPMSFEDSGRVYRCDDCFRTFKHRLSLTNHQRAHGNRQPHVCFICQEPFKYKTNLKRHLRIHARQMRMCKYCHSIMDSDYALVQHEKEHRRVMASKDAEARAAELEATLINGTFLVPGHAVQTVKPEPDSTTNA